MTWSFLKSVCMYFFIFFFFSLYVCVCFVKLKTEFRDIIHSWQINEITCLNVEKGEVKEETFKNSNIDRSSHRRCSVEKCVLKNFTNFAGKHLCWSLFFKGACLQPCNFIKKRLQHSCFPVKFAKFLRTSFLKNICERLLLHRGCGCDVDDVKRTRTNASVK